MAGPRGAGRRKSLDLPIGFCTRSMYPTCRSQGSAGSRCTSATPTAASSFIQKIYTSVDALDERGK